ncbi:MAG: CPBP family intramembrane metalloprotease [Deltaproteobacteria bacterium]|nr:CPBP family intramembrane metalloprotease [Deltaproteobacteria bacterium]
MKLFRSFILLSVLIIAGAIVSASFRIFRLEKDELFHESHVYTLNELAEKPGSTAISARVDTVELRAGEEAVFEVCLQDPLTHERWRNAFEFAVLYLDQMKLMFKTPLDQAHLETVKRDGEIACLVLGGGRIELSGIYSIEAVWHENPPPQEIMKVGFYSRVLGRTALLVLDRLLVIAIAIGAMLLVLTAFFASTYRRTVVTTDRLITREEKRDTEHLVGITERLRLLLIAVSCVAVFWAAISWLPLFGSTMVFIKGLLLAFVEVAVAVWLARRLVKNGGFMGFLALTAPSRRPLLRLGIGVLCAGGLVLIARTALDSIPSTSEAPIQTFIAWPSGMLCFAALGAIAPLGEELFFRGFVYRSLLIFGRIFAFIITLVAFVGFHLPQVWGNWGGLAALVVTGAVLNALRADSGSTLLPAVTHLLYNFVLSWSSL